MAELGNHLVSFPSTDGNSAGDGDVMGPFGDGVSGTITDFFIYLSSGIGATHVRPIIYGASGSDPGALIATLAEITVTSGTGSWLSLTGLSVSFTGPIYIGWWQEATFPDLVYYYDTGGAGFYKSVLATYSSSAAAPDPWPAASDTTTVQKIAVYVVYTPSSAGFTNTAVPTITGTLNVGSTLTANPGTWTPTPGSYVYDWHRADDTSGTNDIEIAGATGATYTLAAADSGKYLRAGVFPQT